jgi:hypothetical protein
MVIAGYRVPEIPFSRSPVWFPESSAPGPDLLDPKWAKVFFEGAFGF